MTWYSVTNTADPTPEEEDARDRLMAAWPDAPIENLEVLSMVLLTARDQVIAYAPTPTGEPTPSVEDGYIVILDPDAVPARHVYAQLRIAILLWNDGRMGSMGDIGPDGYSFTPTPIATKQIRAIIRPPDIKPHVL